MIRASFCFTFMCLAHFVICDLCDVSTFISGSADIQRWSETVGERMIRKKSRSWMFFEINDEHQASNFDARYESPVQQSWTSNFLPMPGNRKVRTTWSFSMSYFTLCLPIDGIVRRNNFDHSSHLPYVRSLTTWLELLFLLLLSGYTRSQRSGSIS